MSTAAAGWERWLAVWRGEEDAKTLALVRVLLGAVVTYDLIHLWHLGLVEALWGRGGIVDIDARVPVPELWRWLSDPTSAAWIGWGCSLLGALGLTLGVFTRASALLFVFAYAQTAQANPNADRGIDTLTRNVALVLAFSGSHHVWSLDAWRARSRGTALSAQVQAWPRRLLALQLIVVYFMAGVQKTALAWTPLGGFSALYLVLQDPSIARWEFGWLAEVYPLTQLATAATMLFEWGAGLVPLAWWFQRTRTRAGWLRAQSNRTGWVRGWMAVGVLLHLGIAATMNLGIFPWTMLSLYPVLLHPDELWRPRPTSAPAS